MTVIKSEAGEMKHVFAETEDAYLGYQLNGSGGGVSVYAYPKTKWSEVEPDGIVDLSFQEEKK